MRSIRMFLLVSISLLVIVVFILAAVASYNRARYETDELFDAELAQTARILRSTLGMTAARNGFSSFKAPDISTLDWKSMGGVSENIERTQLGHAYERKIMFQVFSQGKLVLRTDNSPLAQDWAPEEGFQKLHEWHLFTLVDADTSYTVGERGDIRDEVARKIALSSLYPSLLALPVLLFFLMMALQRGLQPLRDLDKYIQTRNKDNLDTIELVTATDEILPIIESLNNLLARLRRSLESERRFTALASHEMRTPLAVLKVAAQNALKADDETSRIAMLKDIDVGVDRASRLISQLLTLSRLEQDSPGFEIVSLDILPLLREEIAALYPIALQRMQTIELIAEEESVQIRTIPQLFPLVIRNLIDNAIKYSPDHGYVQVRLFRKNGGVHLWVDDSGLGIPPGERSRVFERFYRISGANEKTVGSGLGLAIVRRIAELLGATIELDSSSELDGLSVRIAFPS